MFLCLLTVQTHNNYVKNNIIKIKTKQIIEKEMEVYQKNMQKNSIISFFICHKNLSLKKKIPERPVLTRYYSLCTFWLRNSQWSINFYVCFTNTLFFTTIKISLLLNHLSKIDENFCIRTNLSRVFEIYKNCLQLNNDFLANFWKKFKKLKKQIFFQIWRSRSAFYDGPAKNLFLGHKFGLLEYTNWQNIYNKKVKKNSDFLKKNEKNVKKSVFGGKILKKSKIKFSLSLLQ